MMQNNSESSINYLSNYDKEPSINLSNEVTCQVGWKSIFELVLEQFSTRKGKKNILVLECYHGVHDQEVIKAIESHLTADIILSKYSLLPETEIEKLVYPEVTDDEVFGYISRLRIEQFFDHDKVKVIQKQLKESKSDLIVVFGIGASLICKHPTLRIYLDMARWEIQQRFRRNEISNFGVSNHHVKASLQYKQAFFVDWRVLDRFKKRIWDQCDYFLDTNRIHQPKMLKASDLNSGLDKVANQPFRVVPFFDPGPWGGQWMKEFCDLDRSEINYAWCFDCVPEENSLLFKIGSIHFELPAINLVFRHAKELLGDAVQSRFGDEFPIRFDFLDTIDGGNLSLQVHPTTDYAYEQFGLRYTQDESYYIMDCNKDAHVFLGLNNHISKQQLRDKLCQTQNDNSPFDVEKYVAKWPAFKHDHFLIPAGTIHCSGKNCMVLEISATPYIFTFKLYDWGRKGLDGLPRPINIDRGMDVLDERFNKTFAQDELVNQITTVAEGNGWLEEKTGLHEREFIETRRHWFNDRIMLETQGSVNVINLVEGREVIVESPSDLFDPFIVHYAETFIIPEQIKKYTIRPYGESVGKKCATLKAQIRINP